MMLQIRFFYAELAIGNITRRILHMIREESEEVIASTAWLQSLIMQHRHFAIICLML